MIDITLLRILKYKDDYYKIIGRVPTESMEASTVALLKDYGKYFESFPEHDRVNLQSFAPLFSSWHPKLSVEQKHAYASILKQIVEDVPHEVKEVVLKSMLELRLASEMSNMLLKFDAGDLANIHGAMDEVLTNFRRDAKIRGIDFLRDDIGDLLAAEIDDSGYRSRLNCINDSMRGLRGGDFGITAGRPDRGKTTYLSSELTFMAPQEDKTIVWLNNEGPGKKILSRLYQSALGLPMSGLIDLHRQNKLISKYEQAIKGDKHKIKVFDIHGMDCYGVERIIEQHTPGIVVYDMIDNVRGFGDASRTDLALERMYQWARELTVKYDHVGIATSQISNDGDGLQFPTMGMLKDSKTGKQGACDWQLMIGAVNDPGFARTRFLGLVKNKLRREGGPSDPQAAVAYKSEIGRYEDTVEASE